jgi:DNA-binding winged helix-turn-helix (wHTH) protein
MSLQPSLQHLGENLYIDGESGTLYLDDVPLDLGPQLARVLKVLYERRRHFTKPVEVRILAWPTSTVAPGSPYTAKKSLNDFFTVHGIGHLIWIDRGAQGYRLLCPCAVIPPSNSNVESDALSATKDTSARAFDRPNSWLGLHEHLLKSSTIRIVAVVLVSIACVRI